MKEKKLSTTQNLLWNSIGCTMYMFFQWLLTIVVVRELGYDMNGIFSLAMSLANSFGVIATFGVRNYQVSDIADKYSCLTYVYSRYFSCFIAFIVCIIFTCVNSYDRTTSIVVISYMVFRISENFVDVYQGICQKHERMDIIGISYIVRGISTFVVFVITIKITHNLVYAIFSMVIIAYLVIAFYDIRYAHKMNWIYGKFDVKSIIGLLKECSLLVIYLLANSLIITIPRLFLEYYHGEDMLGIYGAITTPTVLLQVATTFLLVPFVTSFALQYKENRISDFVKDFLKVTGGIIGLCGLGIILCMLLGDFVLKLLFGAEILPFVYLLIPTVMVAFLNAITYLLSSLITIIRQLVFLVLANVCGVIGVFLCGGYLVNKYGLMGTNYAAYLGFAVVILMLLISLIIALIKRSKNEKS